MIRLVSLADKTYAVGLWWLVPSGGPSSAKQMLQLARERAQQENEHYDYVSLRPEQYGLGRYDGSMPKKVLSLAATLRKMDQSDAFVGVFCLEEALWWVCGITRGTIAATDGDTYFSTRQEAIDAAASLRQMITDVDVEVYDTPEQSAAYLLPILLSETPVIPLYPDPKKKKRFIHAGVGALLVFGTLIAGVYFYDSYSSQKQARLEKFSFLERQAQKRDQIAHPEKYFRKVWLDKPLPYPASQQCVDRMLELPLTSNGWLLGEILCQPAGNLQLTWNHTNQADFINLPWVDSKITTPKQSVSKLKLSHLEKRPQHDESILRRDEVVSILYHLTQKLGSRVTITWSPPESRQIDDETTIYAPWQGCVFTLSELPMAAFLGHDLFKALSISGCVINSVTLKNNVWTIKGVIYALTK